MNTQNVNYSDLSVTMIKELLKYDNELNVDSFYQLTYNTDNYICWILDCQLASNGFLALIQ